MWNDVRIKAAYIDCYLEESINMDVRLTGKMSLVIVIVDYNKT